MDLAAIMTDQKYDAGNEVARIEQMINSGPMKRFREAARANGAPVRPKNASSIIVIKGEPGNEQIVMGRRNKALKFMPGALVFPGGRVDRGDGRIKTADDLDPALHKKLMTHMRGKPVDSSAHALGVAAIRELAEETGLLIGEPTDTPPKHADWQMFADKSLAPSVSKLRLVARAITPPGVHRRFDTWFFAMRLEDHHHVPDEGFVSSGELEDLHWVSPFEAMANDTREITRVILVELMKRLKEDPDLSPDFPAPSYVTRADRFQRKLM